SFSDKPLFLAAALYHPVPPSPAPRAATSGYLQFASKPPALICPLRNRSNPHGIPAHSPKTVSHSQINLSEQGRRAELAFIYNRDAVAVKHNRAAGLQLAQGNANRLGGGVEMGSNRGTSHPRPTQTGVMDLFNQKAR